MALQEKSKNALISVVAIDDAAVFIPSSGGQTGGSVAVITLSPTQTPETNQGTDDALTSERTTISTVPPTLKPDITIKQKQEDSVVTGLPMFKGNLGRTSVYQGPAPINGNVNWVFKTNSVVTSSPAMTGGVVYVGCENSNIYAIDAITGYEKWSFKTGGRVLNSPSVVDGVVYFGSDDGNVYALDAMSGEKKWAFHTGNEIDRSSPAVSGGAVYVGSADNNLYAIDASTGEEKWTFTTGGGLGWSSPAVVDGTVYIGSLDGNLYAVDAGLGEKKWVFRCGIDSTPAVSDGVVYAGSGDGKLYAVDADTGEEKWVFNSGGSFWSSPAVSNGVVCIGNQNNNIYAVDAETGEKKWVYQTGNTVASSPAIVDGIVYAGCSDNSFVAIDIATGTEKWKIQPGGPIGWSSPAVVNGVIYVGSDDGNVYAIGDSAGSSAIEVLVPEQTVASSSSPLPPDSMAETEPVPLSDGRETFVAQDDSGWSLSMNTNGEWHYAFCVVSGCNEDIQNPGIANGNELIPLHVQSPKFLGIRAWISGPGDGKQDYQLSLYYGSTLVRQVTFPLKGQGIFGVMNPMYATSSGYSTVTSKVNGVSQGACMKDGVELDCRPP